MNTHADKASKNKGQVIANGLAKSQSESKSPFQLADNRPEAVAQRKLQELADNSQQVSRLRALQQLANASPHVSQLKSLQKLAINSPQLKQAAQLQALSSAKAPSLIQQEIANGIAQLAQVPEEGELIQGKFETVQLQQNQSDSKARQNNTGLPDKLKAGIESLSGMSLDHVKVHYNSSQPAQLNALAYAQGSDIHVAPGQEQHLPHEAWHIVQQAQGRVQPTMQMQDGVPVNDDAGLEREADVMGAKALVPAAPLAGGPEEEKLLQGKLALEAVAQRELADIGNDSPKTKAQQASIRSVLSSPQVFAQARRLDGLFGAAQLRPAPASASYRLPVQRQLSDEDAEIVRQGAGGATPSAEDAAAIIAFFNDIDGIRLVKQKFRYGSLGELAPICRTRFSFADLQALIVAVGDDEFTFAELQTLAGLNGNPTMQHILALRGIQIGGRAVAFADMPAIAQLIYNFDQLRQLSLLANITTWAQVRNLSQAAVPFASIQLYAPLTVGGVLCDPPQMIICHGYRFTAAETVQLCALPQIAQWADLVRLHAIATTVADIITYAGLQISGVNMSLDRLVACNGDRFSPADMQTVIGIAQVTTWPQFERLHAMANWSAADLLLLSNTTMGGELGTLDQMCALAAFTGTDIINIVAKNAAYRNWTTLANLAAIHGAPNDGAPAAATITAMAALGARERKENQAGVLDITRSCWNWATQGFEATDIPDDTIFSYFSRRANFPDVYGGRLNHAETVDFLAPTQAADDPIRVYLDRNQGALNTIVANWIANPGLDGNVANRDAQLALMRLHLTESGFDVQAQGTNTRWRICMHERKMNVGWEHWWIKTSAQDVIETFPATADGRGRSIAFHQSNVNMGDINVDFQHEVPVANLLPAQLAIINRAMLRYKAMVNTLTQP
jgi:hypothetical protein